MTRFDADDPTGRRKLFTDAIEAHRRRSSPFLTVEAEATAEDGAPESGDPLSGTVEDLKEDGESDPEQLLPWIQFAADEGVANLDCTDAELDRLKDLLDEFPSFRIDELTRPEDAEGTNARVSARADPNRVAQFVDEAFQRVYELPEDYRAWVVEL